MTARHIFLLFISIAIFQPTLVFAQEEETQGQEQELEQGVPEPDTDTLAYKEKYGLRVGIDISKPILSFVEEDYTGFEIKGDYRIYEDYYLAAEIGNEKDVISEENITASAQGSYIKLGANYNAYNNWEGMQNSIYVGMRYAFSTFSSELMEYSIYSTNPYFGPDVRSEPQEYNNLTASWVELQLGLKVEIFNNVFLGAHVELKRRISQTTPINFDNLYIPGFNRTYDGSTFGTGFGYSISYLIPLYRIATNSTD